MNGRRELSYRAEGGKMELTLKSRSYAELSAMLREEGKSLGDKRRERGKGVSWREGRR